MRRKTFLFIIFFLIYALSTTAEATDKKKESEYKVIEVTNGGSISGKAVFTGATVPNDEILILTSHQDVCGDTLPARKYLINANREIRNVVVYLEGIKAGKEIPADPVIIDNLICAFEPHVSIGYKGNMVLNRNSDPVLHGIQTMINGRFFYNISIPEKGFKQIEKKLIKAGLMAVKCYIHPWMVGYVYIFTHPYAAVTDEKGEFSIGDIPSGSYEVKAWHEGFGEISLGKVTVAAGGAVIVNANFK